MKILFLIQDYQMPSSRVRVLNMLPELEKRGIRFRVEPYPERLTKKLRMFRLCREFDAVFLQKKLPTPLESIILRNFSKRLIFDFDDAVYLKHDSVENIESHSRYLKFMAIVKRADLVIAGQRILAKEVKRFNSNIVIIPSAVETRNIPVRDWRAVNKDVIIGWVGGAVNLSHLRLVEPVMQRLSKEYRIELRVLCSESIEMDGVNVRFIPWRLETQESEIARFDIGIMPLPNTRHSEGKCGYKALQYMAACVPPVVSDVGINSEIIEHGKEGFVVKDMEEFYKYLKILIKDPDLRSQIGFRARQKVERCYSIQVVSELLADLLLHRISDRIQT